VIVWIFFGRMGKGKKVPLNARGVWGGKNFNTQYVLRGGGKAGGGERVFSLFLSWRERSKCSVGSCVEYSSHFKGGRKGRGEIGIPHGLEV